MKKFLLSLLLVCLLPLSVMAWTNEPPGMTRIVDCPLSGSFCGAQNVYNTFPFVSDATAPLSPPSVLDHALAVGTTEGNGQFTWHFPLARTVYAWTWWKTNADFEGTQNNTNKMFFISQPGVDNSFMSWHGQPNQPKTLRWYMQGLVNNTHVPNTFGMTYPVDGTGWFNPNTADASHATVAAGSGWHKIEVLLTSSTTFTSRDGAIKWWVDGFLVGNFSGVNISPGGFNNFDYNTAWDGFYKCPDARDCSKAWHHYYDHVGVSVSTSGVGVPPADTIAPSSVTGVAVTGTGSNYIALSWNPATDNIGIGGYNFEICSGVGCTSFVAQKTTSGTGTTTTISGLNPATSYSIRMKALDLTGNVSAQYSAVVSATTTSPNNGGIVRNVLATDNYNRVDNTDLGNSWDGDYYVTNATAPLQIVSNKVRAGVASVKESNETYNAVTLPSDQWAEITLSTWSADATKRYAWVNLRAGAPQVPSYYQCQAARNDTNGYTTLIERENGSGVSSYLFQNSAITWLAGDRLSCEAIGINPTTINVYRNDVLVGSVVDNDSLTNLRTGVGIWTDVLAAVEVDDFKSGDFTGVTLPRITGLETDAAGANISWTGGPTSIRINYDAGQIVVAAASIVGGRFDIVWPIDTTFACVFAIDSQGNVNTDTADYICRSVVPSAVDITPPTRSNPLPSGGLAAGTTSTVMSITTSEAATCKYATSPGVAYSAMPNTMAAAVSAIQHTATLTGLVNNTAYTFYIRCADTLINANTTDTVVSFSVNNVSTDVIAPTTPGTPVVTPLNANQIQVAFTLSTDNVGVAGYQVYACITLTCDTMTLVANGSGSPIIVSGLLPATTYSVNVRAQDAVLNFSSFTAIVQVTTPVLDTAPPSQMTGLVATRTGYDSFLLEWAPGTDDRGVVASAIEICVGDGCSIFKLQYIAYGQTSITITGLASQLPYYFRGKHVDSAGNVSEAYSELAKGEPFPLQSGMVQGVCACQIP